MDEVEKKAFAFIKENFFLEKGETVIAGVSGGADSMCMLLLLMKLKDDMDLKIVVAHVNHGIRGIEADADEEFVGAFCRTHGLIFEPVFADIPRLAVETGKTCEEAGRDFRYDFFRKLALKHRSKKIAVAHNCGDNAETVLFNIFRGTGIKGLSGIVPKRSIKDKDGNELCLIRPVLCLTRSEIERFLSSRNQEYRTDHTNSDNHYSRNRIRNEILPQAEKYINSNVLGHISALSRQASDVEDYISLGIDEAMKYAKLTVSEDGHIVSGSLNIEGLSGLHPVIRTGLIRRVFEKLSRKLKDVEDVHIRAIDGLRLNQSGRSLSLPYGITALREYDNIVLKKGSDIKKNQISPDITTPYGEKPEGKGMGVSLKVSDRALLGDIPREQGVKWFDYDRIGSMPVLRNMEDGDYLLIGKDLNKKSLRRFMIDNKIPLSERSGITLLADGSHVLWVVGYRQDESCLVTPDTKKVLIAQITAGRENLDS